MRSFLHWHSAFCMNNLQMLITTNQHTLVPTTHTLSFNSTTSRLNHLYTHVTTMKVSNMLNCAFFSNTSNTIVGITGTYNMQYQVLGLTLLSLVSPPSESWAHTLRDFPPALLQSSSQPATVFKSSDCNDGQCSLRYSKPSERITAAPNQNTDYQKTFVLTNSSAR